MSKSNPVPFLDVGATYRELRGEIDDAVAAVLSSGWFLLGPQLERFEQEFAVSQGAAEGVGVGSGLDALTLTLRALDIGRGDEVIVPSHTFIATWLAVSAVGATVVPVEPSDGSFNIGAEEIAAAMTNRTAAIMPVHLYGEPVDVDAIEGLGQQHGVAVVFDAAQAHGGRWRTARVGGRGTASCWSFYPGKNLGAFGDGGAVTTDDESLAQRVRSLRNYGSTTKYVHDDIGVNSRLDEIQAAVLGVKLRWLDDWNSRRQAIARRYSDEIDNPLIEIPSPDRDAESVWHLYVIRTPQRHELQADLTDVGVQTLVHYPTPPHRQRAYAETPLAAMSLPIAESISTTCLSLPIGPHLTTAMVDRVISSVNAFGR